MGLAANEEVHQRRQTENAARPHRAGQSSSTKAPVSGKDTQVPLVTTPNTGEESKLYPAGQLAGEFALGIQLDRVGRVGRVARYQSDRRRVADRKEGRR